MADTDRQEMKIWIDGEIVGPSEARISVLDHGLLYGDGLFEGIRIYGHAVFRLDDHLRRLAAGAKAIGLELPGGVDAIRRIVLETALAFDRDEAYLRLLVTRGVGEMGVDPLTCPSPRVICIATGISLFSEEKMRRGLSLLTASVRRPPADVLDPRVKSLNYLNSVLAKREARLRGADEALILNAQGLIAEAAVANVFAVRDGALATPPPTDGALEGITRASVLEIAAAEGITATETSLGRFDLFAADEVFLTGSGARIVPVTSLDGQLIGSGEPGPVTAQITEAFVKFTDGRGVAF